MFSPFLEQEGSRRSSRLRQKSLKLREDEAEKEEEEPAVSAKKRSPRRSHGRAEDGRSLKIRESVLLEASTESHAHTQAPAPLPDRTHTTIKSTDEAIHISNASEKTKRQDLSLGLSLHNEIFASSRRKSVKEATSSSNLLNEAINSPKAAAKPGILAENPICSSNPSNEDEDEKRVDDAEDSDSSSSSSCSFLSTEKARNSGFIAEEDGTRTQFNTPSSSTLRTHHNSAHRSLSKEATLSTNILKSRKNFTPSMSSSDFSSESPPSSSDSSYTGSPVRTSSSTRFRRKTAHSLRFSSSRKKLLEQLSSSSSSDDSGDVCRASKKNQRVHANLKKRKMEKNAKSSESSSFCRPQDGIASSSLLEDESFALPRDINAANQGSNHVCANEFPSAKSRDSRAKLSEKSVLKKSMTGRISKAEISHYDLDKAYAEAKAFIWKILTGEADSLISRSRERVTNGEKLEKNYDKRDDLLEVGAFSSSSSRVLTKSRLMEIIQTYNLQFGDSEVQNMILPFSESQEFITYDDFSAIFDVSGLKIERSGRVW